MNSESEGKARMEERAARADECERIEAKIDRDLNDSFPASDPPAWVLGVKRPDAEGEGEAAGRPRVAAPGGAGPE